jgi:hypothetical protein
MLSGRCVGGGTVELEEKNAVDGVVNPWRPYDGLAEKLGGVATELW